MRDVGKAMRVDEMNRHRKTPLRTVVDRAVIASTPEANSGMELSFHTFHPVAYLVLGAIFAPSSAVRRW